MLSTFLGFPGGSDGKVSACNVEDLGSIPGSGRSLGEGNGNLLQYSCLENSMDLESTESQRVGHDGTTSLSFSSTFLKFTMSLEQLFIPIYRWGTIYSHFKRENEREIFDSKYPDSRVYTTLNHCVIL